MEYIVVVVVVVAILVVVVVVAVVVDAVAVVVVVVIVVGLSRAVCCMPAWQCDKIAPGLIFTSSTLLPICFVPHYLTGERVCSSVRSEIRTRRPTVAAAAVPRFNLKHGRL